ncbi:hypothetical protein T06_14071 [Trichinella sp. T6]|nr:hypothetical protein T06_14071 [Trichinella sp. T6]
MKRFMTAHKIQRRTHKRKGFLKILLTKSKRRRTEVLRVLRRVRKQNNTHENTGKCTEFEERNPDNLIKGWLVLYENGILKFKGDKSRMRIYLGNGNVKVLTKDESHELLVSDSKLENGFVIVVGEKKYFFKCDTRNEMLLWVDTLRSTIQKTTRKDEVPAPACGMRRFSSSQELSRVDPGGKSSREAASIMNRQVLVVWCEGSTPDTQKKSSTVSSYSAGSMFREKAGVSRNRRL